MKGSGIAMAASSATTQAAQDEPVATDQAPTVLAGPQQVMLTVNGIDRRVTLEPQMTLLDVLRNQLNVTSCKDVEDTNVAGADTVLIDGKATLAGTRLAIECVGLKIVTAESLGADDSVVAGFVQHDAIQCGYCTPGFVMATTAFLDKNPKASLEEIQAGLGGNICRCGTYAAISKCALEIVRRGSQ